MKTLVIVAKWRVITLVRYKPVHPKLSEYPPCDTSRKQSPHLIFGKWVVAPFPMIPQWCRNSCRGNRTFTCISEFSDSRPLQSLWTSMTSRPARLPFYIGLACFSEKKKIIKAIIDEIFLRNRRSRVKNSVRFRVRIHDRVFREFLKQISANVWVRETECQRSEGTNNFRANVRCSFSQQAAKTFGNTMDSQGIAALALCPS